MIILITTSMRTSILTSTSTRRSNTSRMITPCRPRMTITTTQQRKTTRITITITSTLTH